MYNLRFEISNLKLPAEISGKTYEVLTAFYAKQTQFAVCLNEHKFYFNKGL